ncbi:unnamed protein product, partial [Effrenium voratum]
MSRTPRRNWTARGSEAPPQGRKLRRRDLLRELRPEDDPSQSPPAIDLPAERAAANTRVSRGSLQCVPTIVTCKASRLSARSRPSKSPPEPVTATPSALRAIDLQAASALVQIQDKFIVARTGDKDGYYPGGGFLVIDQHAAAERVELEKLQKQVLSMSLGIDLVPVFGPSTSLTLAKEEARWLSRRVVRAYVERWGFRWRGIQEEVVVTHVPNILGTVLSPLDLKPVLSFAAQGEGDVKGVPPVVLHILTFKACRRAIKFGDPLSEARIRKLVADLSKCEFPFQCAHGRPTVHPLASQLQLMQRGEMGFHLAEGWRCRGLVCGAGHEPELLLLCDGCNLGYHTFCLLLADVPEGEWFCTRRRLRRMQDSMRAWASLAEAVLQAKLRTAFANLDDLLQLEQKLLEPNQESVSEEANARSQANVNETLPRVEGDGLSLTDEWARVPVSELVKACLQSSLSIKQAIADESIDPTEMKQVLRSLGRCSAGGGSFMKKLFTNPDAPFTFHGQLAGDATAKKNAMRKWSEAEVACGKAATHAGSASSTP